MHWVSITEHDNGPTNKSIYWKFYREKGGIVPKHNHCYKKVATILRTPTLSHLKGFSDKMMGIVHQYRIIIVFRPNKMTIRSLSRTTKSKSCFSSNNCIHRTLLVWKLFVRNWFIWVGFIYCGKNYNLFDVVFKNANYGCFSPHSRIFRIANKLPGRLYLFPCSYNSIKSLC